MDKRDIKNIVFVTAILLQLVFFRSSFDELTTLVETNSVSTQDTVQSLDIQYMEQSQGAYENKHILEIYTYKLMQTILLLFGIFLCIVFLAINNQGYSLVETIKQIDEVKQK